MATEGHDYKCLGHWYPRKVEVLGNPDLSGIGVTTAFLVSSVATFIFIVYGIWRNLIFEHPKHPFDHVVLNWLQSKNAPTGKKRELERRAFYAAIVAISDQQLFIGIPFLLAGLTDCSLSIYSSSNLEAFAWLLLNVHLMTLVVMNFGGKSDRYNKRLKAVRIIAMGTMIALSLTMTIIFVISKTNAWAYDKNAVNVNGYSVYYFLAVENYHALPGTIAINVISDMLLFSIFLIAYAFEIALFWDQSYWRFYIQGGLFNTISFKFIARFIYKIRLPPHFSYGAYEYIQTHKTWTYLQNNAKLKSILGTDWNRISAPRKFGFPRGILFMDLNLPWEMDRSLVFNFEPIQYGIIMGVTRFCLCWLEFREEDTETAGDILVWGPGQVIALISVIAPAIAWLHAKYEDENAEFEISDILNDKTHIPNFKLKVRPEGLAASLNAYFRQIGSLWLSVLNRYICGSTSTGLTDQKNWQVVPPTSEAYDILASAEANAYSTSSFYKLQNYIRYAKFSMCLDLVQIIVFTAMQVVGGRPGETLSVADVIIVFIITLFSGMGSYLIALVFDICYLSKRSRKDSERLERRTGIYSLTSEILSPLGVDIASLLESNVSESTRPILEHTQRPMIESNLIRRQQELVQRLQEAAALEQKAIRSLEVTRKEVEAKELEIRMMRKETSKLEAAQDLLSVMELGIHELCAGDRLRFARVEEDGCWHSGDIATC